MSNSSLRKRAGWTRGGRKGVHFMVRPDLLEALNRRVEETGAFKIRILEAALEEYLEKTA